MMIKFQHDKLAVGERVSASRRKLRYTQEELAEMIEKSLRTVTDVERGVAGMSTQTLLDICSVLETTPNALLLPECDLEDEDLNWLVHALTNCSQNVRKTAIDLVRVYLRSI